MVTLNRIFSTFWSRIGYRTLVVRTDRVSDVLICRKSVEGDLEALLRETERRCERSFCIEIVSFTNSNLRFCLGLA